MILENFKNTENGSCIILGSSPSIYDIPKEFLEKFKIIGVNRSYLYVMPDYHCTIDVKHWIQETKQTMNKENIPYFISPHWGKVAISLSNEVHIRAFNNMDKYRYLDVINNPDLLLDGTTANFGVVPELAIPLAFYMGFEKVYLAGVDYSTENGLYFYQDQKSNKDYEDLQKNLKLKPFEDRVHLFNKIGLTNKQDKIFNLSEKSLVTCFKKIHYSLVNL